MDWEGVDGKEECNQEIRCDRQGANEKERRDMLKYEYVIFHNTRDETVGVKNKKWTWTKNPC